MIANTVANTVTRITNSVFVITYLSVWVANMSDLLISRICQGATLRNTGLSPITVRNIEACRTMGRPIYTGYFPLNKGSSLEKQQLGGRARLVKELQRHASVAARAYWPRERRICSEMYSCRAWLSPHRDSNRVSLRKTANAPFAWKQWVKLASTRK